MALWPPFTVLIWRRAEQTHLKGYFCLHISKEGKLNVSRKIAIFKSWLPQPIMWAKQKHPPLTLIRFKREGSRRKFANCQKADTQIPTAQGDKKRGFSDFAHPKLPSLPLSRLAGVCTNAGSCWEAKSFLQSFWSPPCNNHYETASIYQDTAGSSSARYSQAEGNKIISFQPHGAVVLRENFSVSLD